jgi:pyruvate formate lyase activating enzyme
MHVDQVLSEVLADRVFYEESGGGVTVSGGEPLLQAEFANEILQSCRSHGIHTAVDTCGHGPWETLQRVASHADLILFDLKLMNSARHDYYTGASNENIVSNLKSLAEMHDAVWLRVPVIPGVNDSEDEMDSMAELASALPGARRVTLLPYHRAGVGKHARLGRAYPLSDTPTPSSDQMRRHVARFRAAGMLVSTGVFR